MEGRRSLIINLRILFCTIRILGLDGGVVYHIVGLCLFEDMQQQIEGLLHKIICPNVNSFNKKQ